MDKNIQESKKATAHVMAVHEKIKENPLRQRYHFEVPSGWGNDPNGFSYLRGEYHLFYQHMPYVALPDDYKMSWGHASSRDLVTWNMLPVALSPVDSYDAGGCWSGCALELDGKIYLIYTGLDEKNGMQQGQCMAVSEDGINFSKAEGNPILAKTLCDADKKDFRDPFIWRERDEWNMVIGSTKNGLAQALLYRSDDLRNWRFINTLAGSLGELGSVCECPNFFEIGGKHVLFISPHGLNQRKSVYLTGDFDYESGKFFWNTYGEIDWGMDFYAPQVIADEKGRKVLIGWMNSWPWMPWCTKGYYTASMGWCGGMSLPRKMSLDKDHRLHFMPVEELESYRINGISMGEFIVGEEAVEIQTSDNSHCEIIVDLDLSATTADTVKFELKSNGGECAWLGFDLQKAEIYFDRTNTKGASAYVRSCDFLSVRNPHCRVHLFIDSSSVEMFTDDYMTCMSNNVYVSEDATQIRLHAVGGTAAVLGVQAWEIKALFQPYQDAQKGV